MRFKYQPPGYFRLALCMHLMTRCRAEVSAETPPPIPPASARVSANVAETTKCPPRLGDLNDPYPASKFPSSSPPMRPPVATMAVVMLHARNFRPRVK